MPSDTPMSAQPTQNRGLGPALPPRFLGAVACWRAMMACGERAVPPAPPPGIKTVLLIPPPEASMAWVRFAAPAGGAEGGKFGAACPYTVFCSGEACGAAAGGGPAAGGEAPVGGAAGGGSPMGGGPAGGGPAAGGGAIGGAPEDCGTLCTGSGPETGPILVAGSTAGKPALGVCPGKS